MLNQNGILNLTHIKNPDVHIDVFIIDHTSLYIWHSSKIREPILLQKFTIKNLWQLNNFRYLYPNDANFVTPITAALPVYSQQRKVILQNW